MEAEAILNTAGVRIVNLKKEIVFDYQLEDEAMWCLLLPNGNTLATVYKPVRLVKLDKEGQQVWELTAKDLPADMNLQYFCDVRVLDNGNFLRSNCNYRDMDVSSVIFEVNRDKKVIWELRDSKRLQGATSVKRILE